MSMLKKLKSIFVVEDENPSNSVEKSTGSTSDNSELPSSRPSSAPIADLTDDSTPDNKFIEMLLKAIEAQNLDGFDYLEFKQSLQSLVKVESIEEKRFQNAFAMASTLGLSKDKLFKSAQHYANVLNDEQKKFEEAFQKQKAAQVSEKENRIKSLQQTVKDKQNQLKQLQKEIGDAETQLGSVEAQINQSLAKIEGTYGRFYASYNLVLGQIKDDISKIEKYI